MLPSTPILLGQYRPLDSYLHRLDARAKMVPVMLVLILALMTHSFLYYIVILASLMASLAWARVGFRSMVSNFKPLIILVAVTALYHLIFSGEGTAVAISLPGWTIYSGGIQQAGFYSLRLVLFITIAFLMTLTSSPSELAEAVVRCLRPLKRIRVPIDDLSLIMFMAIRFIPVLYEEFISIRNAQIVRGVNFSGSFFARIRKTSCIIIPVFVSAIGRADDIAMAIEARGYGRLPNRTTYSRSRFGSREILFAIVSVVFVVVIYLFTL